MATFPTALPSYLGFTAAHTLAADQHASQHNSEQADITAIATKIGTGASTPVNQRLLRGNGTGTSAWAQVDLTTDVTGVLPVANGGTGTTSTTGTGSVVFSTAPALTGGGSWAGSPTFSTPTIADFTNATHSHTNNAGGGTLNAANALQSGSITSSKVGTDSSWGLTDYSSLSTIVGWSSFTTKFIRYTQIGKLVFVTFTLDGTSNSGSSTFTLPIAQRPLDGISIGLDVASGLVIDSGAIQTSPARIYIDSSVSSSTVQLIKGLGSGTWTNSGSKSIRGSFFYETN